MNEPHMHFSALIQTKTAASSRHNYVYLDLIEAFFTCTDYSVLWRGIVQSATTWAMAGLPIDVSQLHLCSHSPWHFLWGESSGRLTLHYLSNWRSNAVGPFNSKQGATYTCNCLMSKSSACFNRVEWWAELVTAQPKPRHCIPSLNPPVYLLGSLEKFVA